MPNKKIELQNLRLDTRYEKLKELSGKEFNKIKKFIHKAKNGENNGGVDISEQTERKYVDALTMAYKNIEKKQLSQLTKTDLTNLKQDLKKGKIKSRYKQPYTMSSQREMEFVLIRFLEELNPEKYSGFRKWFVIKVPRTSVEYLKEEEIEKLRNACTTNSERFLISVLFDSGMRASEFLNTRFEDWTKPTQSFPYYKVLIKEEYSKTGERNIGLYWKHCTKDIKNYLEELDDSDPKAPVYPKNYDAIRRFLTRLGKRVLDKRIHFHIFRKSSASYYATKLKSRQQLCYRYAWRFSSSMPDIYISREQGEEEVKETMFNTTLEKLEKENQELKEKIGLQDEDFSTLRNQFDKLGKSVDRLKKPGQPVKQSENLLKMLLNLTNHQREMSMILEKITGKKFDVVLPSVRTVTNRPRN